MSKAEMPDIPDFGETRRRAILDTAKACFLQFGFDKTMLEDIARRAGISRPLIYRAFKSKVEILAVVYDDLFLARYARVDQIIAGPGNPHDKLTRAYDILLLEPWAEMIGTPMAYQLVEACARLNPAQQAAHDARHQSLTSQILADDALAQVFCLATKGLQSDLPDLATLQQRLGLLISRFVG